MHLRDAARLRGWARVTIVIGAMVWLTADVAEAAAAVTLRASSTNVAPGGGDVLTGAGFRAGETVTLSLDSTTLATAKASSTGTFTKTVTIPKTTVSGNHTLHAVGGTSGRS